MRQVVCPDGNLPDNNWATPTVYENYDCSNFDSRLKGMLLSPRAFERVDEKVKVWISNNALRYLEAYCQSCQLKNHQFIAKGNANEANEGIGRLDEGVDFQSRLINFRSFQLLGLHLMGLQGLRTHL